MLTLEVLNILNSLIGDNIDLSIFNEKYKKTEIDAPAI